MAEAIFSAVERSAEDWRRPHLGASLIGEPCHRKLWYIFRWAARPSFDGRMLRLFRRGDDEEARVIGDLRDAFMVVSGTQTRFAALGGHFGGSCDGLVSGVPGAEKTLHLLEVKTSNAKRFAVLVRDGVQKSNPKHFVQMQVYMHAFKLARALYICVCKDDDSIHTERVKIDHKVAKEAYTVAETVVYAPEPLSRISEDPAWFECRLCDHREHCHKIDPSRIERNCRTCISSTPQPDGSWTCDHHGKTLSVDAQKIGCGDHRIIPSMVGWEIARAVVETREIVYRDRHGVRHTDTGVTLEARP